MHISDVKIPVQHNKLPIHHIPVGHTQVYRNHYKSKPLPPAQSNGKRIIKPIRIGGTHNNRDDLKASASSGTLYQI